MTLSTELADLLEAVAETRALVDNSPEIVARRCRVGHLIKARGLTLSAYGNQWRVTGHGLDLKARDLAQFEPLLARHGVAK